MAGLSAMGRDRSLAQQIVDRTNRRRSTRPSSLHGRNGCRPNPIRNLQDHSPVYHPDRQKGIKWPISVGLPSCLAPQHRRASAGSRRRGECYSCLAGPLQLGNHQSVCRNYSSHQASCSGKVRNPSRVREEDSAEARLADGCRSAELAPVSVTLCVPEIHGPLESGPLGRPGHITRPGTLHRLSLSRQRVPFQGVSVPGDLSPAPDSSFTRSPRFQSTFSRFRSPLALLARK
jgi:hypothetical protein